jgi:ribosomal protein S27AE
MENQLSVDKVAGKPEVPTVQQFKVKERKVGFLATADSSCPTCGAHLHDMYCGHCDELHLGE